MPNVIKVPQKKYNEIYQSVAIKYSFVNKVDDDTYRELFSPVACRDFLGDALYAEEKKIPFVIYGFDFQGQRETIDKDKTRLLISNMSSAQIANLSDNRRILSEVEAYHNLEPTRPIDYDDPQQPAQIDELLFEASPQWQKTAYLISLYTYLIRVMCYKYKDLTNWREELEKMPGNEGDYMRQCSSKKFVRFVQELFNICNPYKGVSGQQDNPDIYELHNHSGFVSVCTGVTFGKYPKRFQEILKQK